MPIEGNLSVSINRFQTSQSLNCTPNIYSFFKSITLSFMLLTNKMLKFLKVMKMDLKFKHSHIMNFKTLIKCFLLILTIILYGSS